MKELLDFTFQSAWHFIGMLILLNVWITVPLHIAFKFWNRFMRMLMIRKHGWPPDHLDGDGDFAVDM